MDTTKNNSGSYLLIIKVEQLAKIVVGALGNIAFKPGDYIYIGRASRHLRQRLERHISREKKLRWHVDYLLQFAKVTTIYITPAIVEQEVARRFAESDAYEMVTGFGASDSPLPSHLFRQYGSKADEELMILKQNYDFSRAYVCSER